MLKSAEVIRGTITDSIPGTSVTILAGDSLSRTIPEADIQLITTEVRRRIYTQKAKQPRVDHYESSAYYQGVLSGGFGIGINSASSVKVNFINGVGFNQIGSVGAGIGLRLPLESEVVVIPAFFDARFRLMKSRIAPCIALGFGRCFQPDQEWENTSSIVTAEAGISIKKSGKSSVMLTIGYESYDVLNPIESHLTTSFNGGIVGFGSTPSTERETIRTLTVNLAVVF